MGRSAKLYKRPTLKDKQARKQRIRSSSIRTLATTLVTQPQKETEEEAHQEAEGSTAKKAKDRGLKSKLKKSTEGDKAIRVPRDAGIDYLRQWDSRAK